MPEGRLQRTRDNYRQPNISIRYVREYTITVPRCAVCSHCHLYGTPHIYEPPFIVGRDLGDESDC